MKRPIIAVDVDEVCADLLTEWVRRYNVAWNDSLLPSDINGWDMTAFVKPECGGKIYDILHEPGLYRNVWPFPAALPEVRSLRTLGRVVFLTSCTHDTMNEKLAWLKTWGFLPNDRSATNDFIACRDKWLVNADVLLDDAVHNVESFPGAAFLVPHHHNEKTPCSRERLPGPGIAGAYERVKRFLQEGT